MTTTEADTSRQRIRRITNGSTTPAAPPAMDADKVAKDIENASRRIEALKAGLSAQDKAITRAETALRDASPLARPGFEEELNLLIMARKSSRDVLAQAEDQLEHAMANHKHAQLEACHLSEDCAARVATIAVSAQAALKSATEALRSMYAEADTIKVLGIEIRAYANRQAILSAMHAAGLAEFANLPPVHNPQPLPHAIANWQTNIRAQRAQLKSPKENKR